MSEKEKSTIESIADALWNRAARGASATFRHAIDDLAGIDNSKGTDRTTRETERSRSASQGARRNDDETLEEFTVAAKRFLDFADKKYRDLVHDFMGEAGTDGSSAHELKRIAERLIHSVLDSSEQDRDQTSSDLKSGAQTLAAWFADAVSDQAFETLHPNVSRPTTSSSDEQDKRKPSSTTSKPDDVNE